MNSIEIKLQDDQRRYLEFAKKHKGKKFFIFGAGRMAKPLFLFLDKNGIKLEAFCVSNKALNKSNEYNIPIIEIDEIYEDKDNVAFFLGVNPKLNLEIEQLLQEKGFINYILSTEAIRNYGEERYEFFKNPMMEITTKIGCEVNCKYCPQEVFLKKYFETRCEDKMMSFETFKTCIDKMPKNVLIEFAGFTEPFFNPECVDMILYAYGRGHKVSLFTTLRGVNKEILEKILDVQFEEFVLHVPDEEGYSVIPITEEYLKLIDKLVTVKKANGEEFVDYISSQGTIPEIVKEHLGNNVRIFTMLTDRAGNLSDEVLYSKKNLRGRIRCELSSTINHNILLPDGRVTICSQDFGLKHVLGNLLESTYDEVVNGNVARHILACMDDINDTSILCRDCCQAYVLDDREEK